MNFRFLIALGPLLAMPACLREQTSISTLFSQPEFQSLEPGNWGDNRRFLFLARTLAGKGFMRCEPFLRARNCDLDAPKLVSQNVSRKKGKIITAASTKEYTDKNLVLQNKSSRKPRVVLTMPYYQLKHAKGDSSQLLDKLMSALPHIHAQCRLPWKIILTGSEIAEQAALYDYGLTPPKAQGPQVLLINFSGSDPVIEADSFEKILSFFLAQCS